MGRGYGGGDDGEGRGSGKFRESVKLARKRDVLRFSCVDY